MHTIFITNTFAQKVTFEGFGMEERNALMDLLNVVYALAVDRSKTVEDPDDKDTKGRARKKFASISPTDFTVDAFRTCKFEYLFLLRESSLINHLFLSDR